MNHLDASSKDSRPITAEELEAAFDGAGGVSPLYAVAEAECERYAGVLAWYGHRVFGPAELELELTDSDSSAFAVEDLANAYPHERPQTVGGLRACARYIVDIRAGLAFHPGHPLEELGR